MIRTMIGYAFAFTFVFAFAGALAVGPPLVVMWALDISQKDAVIVTLFILPWSFFVVKTIQNSFAYLSMRVELQTQEVKRDAFLGLKAMETISEEDAALAREQFEHMMGGGFGSNKEADKKPDGYVGLDED